MSVLFKTVRFSIAYHIGNIFKEVGLNKNTSVEIFGRSENKASRRFRGLPCISVKVR